MIDQVRRAIERHSMFAPGHRVGVAVSGGADSVFLLYALHELAPVWNLHLTVIHVDHGIRGEASREDARFVRDLAAQFGLHCHLREASISELNDNLEQAGRRVRMDFFHELIGSGAVDRVATGHTLSDQGETVLYRLFRGAGLTGLCGILPLTAEGLVRPLLYVKRTQVEEWLNTHQVAWRQDETNEQRTYARNRLRHEILPLLRETFNPRLDEVLGHMATLAQDEEEYWNRNLLARPLGTKFRIEQVTGLHPALARRLIRRVLGQVKGDLRQIDFAHVETVLEIARSSAGSARVQLPGLDIFRSFDWMRIAPAGFDNGRDRDFEFPVNPPGSVLLPGGNTILTFSVRDRETHDKLGDELDWQRLTYLSDQISLRNWRPGDHYRRIGQSDEQKIKLLFQEARIPLWDRRPWPVLTCRGRILWTRQFGPAAEFAADTTSRTVLRVEEQVCPE